jgi:hypothetical protein
MYQFNRNKYHNQDTIDKIRGKRKSYPKCTKKNKIKKCLIETFGKYCFFTEIYYPSENDEVDINNINNSLSIEHFIPRNKDKQTNKYDYEWTNLFLSDKIWNNKKSIVDQEIDEEIYNNWLKFVSSPSKYFSYHIDKINKLVEIIPNKSVSDENKIEILFLINKLNLNQYETDGIQIQSRRYNSLILSDLGSLNFPSMFQYFNNQQS